MDTLHDKQLLEAHWATGQAGVRGLRQFLSVRNETLFQRLAGESACATTGKSFCMERWRRRFRLLIPLPTVPQLGAQRRALHSMDTCRGGSTSPIYSLCSA